MHQLCMSLSCTNGFCLRENFSSALQRETFYLFTCVYYWLNYSSRVLGHDLAIKLLKMQQLDDEDDELAYR